MHVLYHHRTAGDRVEAVHIMGIVRALRRMGHTVEISSPPGCDPERKAAKAATQAATAPVEGPARRRLKQFARTAPPVFFELAELACNPYSLFDMARRGMRRKPELILERTTSNSISPTLLARWWNIPIVQEVNVTADIGRLRPLVLGYLTRLIERWTVRRAALIVTVSEEFRRLLVGHGFPAEKIIVCQNAIDAADFDPAATPPAPRPQEMSNGAVVVGYVGAFVPWHRTEMLVEAARQLAPRYPQARWLLVGDGVERPKVEGLLAEHRLAQKFWLPGAVTHKLVPGYVSAMDVAVMPHSNPHGSPMKLFEYMAMGRAVVAPDVPAIREVIQDGANGLLFPIGDTAALVAALKRLMDDEALRLRLGRRARQDVLERHTWEQNARRVLEGIAGRRHRREVNA